MMPATPDLEDRLKAVFDRYQPRCGKQTWPAKQTHDNGQPANVIAPG